MFAHLFGNNYVRIPTNKGLAGSKSRIQH